MLTRRNPIAARLPRTTLSNFLNHMISIGWRDTDRILRRLYEGNSCRLTFGIDLLAAMLTQPRAPRRPQPRLPLFVGSAMVTKILD